MRHKYLYVSERGFANEHTIYKVRLDQYQAAYDLMNFTLDNGGKSQFITAKRAREKISYNKKLYRTGQANCCNPAGCTEIEEFNH